MSCPQRPRRICEGSRVDRALGIMERLDKLNQEEFRDMLLDMSKDKTQADALRNDLLKRGLVLKTVRYELTPVARQLMDGNEA